MEHMRRIINAALAAICLSGCGNQQAMGTYGYDLNFLKDNGIDAVELASEDGASRIIVVPAWQGRVMTSTPSGMDGASFGWMNHDFIASGEVSPQFNNFGGEERFWLGPEGGPFSWYFRKGEAQEYSNWKVPSFEDTDAFSVLSKSGKSIEMALDYVAVNASDVEFSIGARRKVSLLDRSELESLLGVSLPDGVDAVAYRTENTLVNNGDSAWTKETGMPSVWLLGMYAPTPTTTVFIPYESEYSGKPVKDDYFGPIPSDRLVVEDGLACFRIDGKFRSKLGLPAGSAKDLCGSYDSEAGVLNILKYTVPEGACEYVNSQWGPQDDPFCGDVINSYNDGPTETGTIMGPFYEIETSSPAAALAPGDSLTHVQTTIHLKGTKDELSLIAKAVFAVDLVSISTVFK